MRLNYKKSGVDYDVLDPVKKLAQVTGTKTAQNLRGTGFREIKESRGESAYILEFDDYYFAYVVEGLGSKNLIADEMRKITGKTYYDVIAYDTVISIVMDITSVGAKPLTVLSYWAIGDSAWMNDGERMEDFIYGWRKACNDVGVAWGGGETPTLKDIIYANTIDLAGAAFGIIKPKKRLVLGNKIKKGDIIILFESSGIHVNGLTLARKLVDRLPAGFVTKLDDGRLYGEVLLTPTVSYSKLVENLQDVDIDIHYMVNITGHGWRKIMRAKENLSYVIEKMPPVLPIFKFIQNKAGLSDKEMYATFNMGAGFAIFVDRNDTDKIIEIANKHKIKAWIGGKVKKGPKQVIIEPLNIIYKEGDLAIR